MHICYIRDAIKTLKFNKAVGEDGIQADILIADPQTAAEILQSWTKGLIVKLPKKGDLRSCGNWSGINPP